MHSVYRTSQRCAPIPSTPISTPSPDFISICGSRAEPIPGGVPVATVAINGAKNAGILAAQILGTSDSELMQKVSAFKAQMRVEVEAKAQKMEQGGYE